MRQLKFYIILISVLSCSNLLAQKHHHPDIAAIVQVIKTQEISWNEGNLEGFMKGYWNSPELRFVTQKGVKYGWQPVYDSFKKAYPNKDKMGVLTFEVISTELLGMDQALVIGKWEVKAKRKTKGGYFTLWFRKINEEWVITTDHTS